MSKIDLKSENKHKKIILFSLMGLLLIVIIFLGVFIYMKQRNFIDLKVGDSVISDEEFETYIQMQKYPVKVEIQKQASIPFDENFWEKEINNKKAYELLADSTLEQIRYVHAVYDLAYKYGDVDSPEFEAIQERLKKENQERKAKTERGEVVYGLKEFSFDVYLNYEISTLKEKYCNDKTREGMDISEEELREHYATRDWVFGREEKKADFTTAKVAVEKELREQRYDNLVAQTIKQNKVEVDEDSIYHFTLKKLK